MIRKVNTLLIILSLIIYVYGYEIVHIFYDATGLTGEFRQDAIHSYWNMRLGIYALIILIAFWIAKQHLTAFQNMLVNIGIEFALWSAIDKIILNEYGQSPYDKLIIFGIILFELWKYKKKSK